MSTLAQKRTKIAGLLTIVALSAISMLWLFWRHPLTTAIVTIVILAAFAISARLARLVDSDGISDLQRANQPGYPYSKHSH